MNARDKRLLDKARLKEVIVSANRIAFNASDAEAKRHQPQLGLIEAMRREYTYLGELLSDIEHDIGMVP